MMPSEHRPEAPSFNDSRSAPTFQQKITPKPDSTQLNRALALHLHINLDRFAGTCARRWAWHNDSAEIGCSSTESKIGDQQQ
jgi:hypothetical protein